MLWCGVGVGVVWCGVVWYTWEMHVNVFQGQLGIFVLEEIEGIDLDGRVGVKPEESGVSRVESHFAYRTYEWRLCESEEVVQFGDGGEDASL